MLWDCFKYLLNIQTINNGGNYILNEIKTFAGSTYIFISYSWMTLMYKQQTQIVSLNFRNIINLFFKSDWLIAMLFQGQQRYLSRNMSHLVKSGSAHSLLSSSGIILILGWTIPLRKALFRMCLWCPKIQLTGFWNTSRKRAQSVVFQGVWYMTTVRAAICSLPCCHIISGLSQVDKWQHEAPDSWSSVHGSG